MIELDMKQATGTLSEIGGTEMPKHICNVFEGTILVKVAYCPYCGIKCKDGYAELHIFPEDQTSVCRHEPTQLYSDFCEIPDGRDE